MIYFLFNAESFKTFQESQHYEEVESIGMRAERFLENLVESARNAFEIGEERHLHF